MDAVRANCKTVVLGNHDIHPAQIIPQHNGGFEYPADWYSKSYPEKKALAGNRVWHYELMELNALLSEADLAQFREFKEVEVKPVNGKNVLFTHYAYPNLLGTRSYFVEGLEGLQLHFDFMTQQNCTLSFSGHHHVNGVIIATESSFELKPFGTYALPEQPVWIDLPAVVRDRNPSGVAAYDSLNRTLEVLPI